MGYYKLKCIAFISYSALAWISLSVFALDQEETSQLQANSDTIATVQSDTTSNNPLSTVARSDAAVNSVVQKHRKLFNYYFRRVWKYNQKARGSIKIRVIIQNNGRVKDIEVLSDTVKIRSLTRFILKHAKQWQFDPEKNGGSVIDLIFPFIPA